MVPCCMQLYPDVAAAAARVASDLPASREAESELVVDAQALL